MERPRPTETPVEEIYREMTGYWGIQRKLFNINGPAKPPRIVSYKAGNGADWRTIKGTVQMFPNVWIGDRLFIKAYLKGEILTRPQEVGWYSDGIESIVVNRQNCPEDKSGVLAELAVHSLIVPKDDGIEFSPSDLRKVIRPDRHFGVRAFSMLGVYLKNQTVLAETNGFFPPIGFSYLFKERYKEHLFPFTELVNAAEKSAPRSPAELKFEAGRLLIRYLPQLAGVALLDLYQGDSVRLLVDHPELKKLKAIELWEKYCWPLLTQTDESLQASFVRS